jgi:spermidine synthase
MAIIIDLLKRHFSDYTAIATLDGVKFEVDEARSWFARTPRSFDVIQMSLIDTWAATGAGAFTLTENGLYTVEAWQLFLGRLTPGGLFTVSRW